MKIAFVILQMYNNRAMRRYLLLLVSLCLIGFAIGKINCKNVKIKQVEEINKRIDSLLIGPHRIFPSNPNTTYHVSKDVDLEGYVYNIPEGVTIIPRGGLIKNGILVGNNTKIKGLHTVFDHVYIKGTWDVANISTSLFHDMKYDNALRDLVALCNPLVNNIVTIEEGDYTFTFTKENDRGLDIPSNTRLIIDGNLHISPNPFKKYNVIFVGSKDVDITGRGSIIGDKAEHEGTEGEWGMGVRFKGAYNCRIYGMKIMDCWGDCIVIAHNSKDIKVEKCQLINGRRQGISICSAENVTIKNCIIKDVKGKAPEYAIDIEPDKGDTVKNVRIERVTAINCRGGFSAYAGPIGNKYVGSVKYNNCIVRNSQKASFRIDGVDGAEVINNYVFSSKSKCLFLIDRSKNVYIRGNRLNTPNYIFNKITGFNIQGNKIEKGELVLPKK